MKQTYQHIFQDKAKVTLTVEVVGETIAFHCVPQIVDEHNEAEYIRWRDEVILPDLMERFTPAQVAMFASLAFDSGEEESR